ncbi:MAG TPA: outer membrane lipoprotein chaperone LolA [Vicinamibacterales bacterium]|nr:outer membrane lipoprotein chaperone LolA [Vicinamibacterales bacterium]
MRIPTTLCVLLVIAGTTHAQKWDSPDAFARALQKRYDGIRDFTADFVHTYRGGALRTESREQGTVSIKKPGLMRWVYTKPERKEFVSDGHKVYSYIPEDRQVIVTTVPAEDAATTPAMFLAGKGDIVRDFTTSFESNPPPGTVSLRLTPRKVEPEYEYLIVTVDEKTLQLRALTTRDRQGGLSTLSFTNLKENTGISDKEFVFRVPRGVDVITDGTRK